MRCRHLQVNLAGEPIANQTTRRRARSIARRGTSPTVEFARAVAIAHKGQWPRRGAEIPTLMAIWFKPPHCQSIAKDRQEQGGALRKAQ